MISNLMTSEVEHEVIESNILAQFGGSIPGPTVIVIGGIHGNEKAGIKALIKITKVLKDKAIEVKGNFFALYGNIHALKKNIRYNEVDLNRIWNAQHIARLKASDTDLLNYDVQEQKKLYHIIKEILENNEGPFYFFDLHTTSSDTIPFITISDSLNNRKFAAHFTVPVVLGIEEYIEGPLLTYINEFGHIALGFEGGQHDSELAVRNCEAFVWLALKASGALTKGQIQNYDTYRKLLKNSKKEQHFYEIDYRYAIGKNEDYKMHNGFLNFEKIRKDQLLGYSNSEEVRATMKGKIFMPLYQKQGEDGFFIIRRISKFWLELSRIARKLKLHNFLRLLPGIQQDKKDPYTLIVNESTAAFLATEIFHLFGYRKRVLKKDKLYFTKRDRKVSGFI